MPYEVPRFGVINSNPSKSRLYIFTCSALRLKAKQKLQGGWGYVRGGREDRPGEVNFSIAFTPLVFSFSFFLFVRKNCYVL